MSAVISLIRRIEANPTTAHVYGEGSGRLASVLTYQGLSCEPLDHPDDIEHLDPFSSVVVAVASPVRPRTSLAIVNTACVDWGLTWLPISLDDTAACVGPLVIPGISACLDCSAGDDVTVEYRSGVYRELEGRPPTTAAPQGAHELGLSLAAVVLARWFLHDDAQLPGRQFSIAVSDLAFSQVWWPRQTACMTCGDNAV